MDALFDFITPDLEVTAEQVAAFTAEDVESLTAELGIPANLVVEMQALARVRNRILLIQPNENRVTVVSEETEPCGAPRRLA